MKVLFALVLLLSFCLSLQAQRTGDDLSRTIAACGKPDKDLSLNPRLLIKGAKTRILTYDGYDLHFTYRREAPAEGFVYVTTALGGTYIRDRQQIAKDIPCMAAVLGVAPAAALTQDPAAERAAKAKDHIESLSVFVWLALCILLYFVPCVVASSRGVAAPGGIQAVNLLLGWTLIGWVVALAWASSAETREQVKAKTVDYQKLAAAMAARERNSQP